MSNEEMETLLTALKNDSGLEFDDDEDEAAYQRSVFMILSSIFYFPFLFFAFSDFLFFYLLHDLQISGTEPDA